MGPAPAQAAARAEQPLGPPVRLRAKRNRRLHNCPPTGQQVLAKQARLFLGGAELPLSGETRGCSSGPFKYDRIGTALSIHGVDGFMGSIHEATELETEQTGLLRSRPQLVPTAIQGVDDPV